jgi:anti-sigma B factor antagonist
MPNSEGSLRIQKRGQTISCHVTGQATMQQSPALRHRVEHSLATGLIALHVDLEECTYMDSTFIGTLLLFKRRLREFALVAPSPECCRLLKKMGLVAVFCIIPKEFLPSSLGEVLDSESAGDNFKRTIVEAHQELASMPGPAGVNFRGVAADLTHGWEKEQQKLTTTRTRGE